MRTVWWNRDEARARTVWRDDKLVERVGRPKGDISFDRLYGELIQQARWRRRYNAPVLPEVNFPTTADEIAKLHSRLFAQTPERAGRRLRAAVLSPGRYTSAPLRPEIPPMIGSPHDLDDACADERLTAYGRLDGGPRQPIPPRDCACGGPSEQWKDIVYKADEVRKAFPADGDNAPNRSDTAACESPPQGNMNMAADCAEEPDECDYEGNLPLNDQPPASQAAPAPIKNEQNRQAAFLKWTKKRYAAELKKRPKWLPSRDDLLKLGRKNIASNVNREDVAEIRRALLPPEDTKGGAAFHANNDPKRQPAS